MSEQFHWRDEYRLGIAQIDEQHQQLFRIANRVFSDLPPGDLEEALMELFRYTREHFRAEEAYMKEVGYPGLLRHRVQHDDLLDQLNEYAAKVVRDPGQMPALRAFIASWIGQHILTHDLAIARYLEGH